MLRRHILQLTLLQIWITNLENSATVKVSNKRDSILEKLNANFVASNAPNSIIKRTKDKTNAVYTLPLYVCINI